MSSCSHTASHFGALRQLHKTDRDRRRSYRPYAIAIVLLRQRSFKAHRNSFVSLGTKSNVYLGSHSRGAKEIISNAVIRLTVGVTS
jgi:hypothetical protein